ncbi:hypothetical protein M5689_013476 [Euphorbia peplus]|nr:hypothetical protein M5689_013476 [Euphorbia peplus]
MESSEDGNVPHRRSLCITGCIMPFPVHEEEVEYCRINYRRKRIINRRWRNVIRRLVREGKSSFYGYSSSLKPLSFRYDAVSYSQNFEEPSHSLHFNPTLFNQYASITSYN